MSSALVNCAEDDNELDTQLMHQMTELSEVEAKVQELEVEKLKIATDRSYSD